MYNIITRWVTNTDMSPAFTGYLGSFLVGTFNNLGAAYLITKFGTATLSLSGQYYA